MGAFARDVSVRDFGARPDGSVCTEAFASAIRAAAKGDRVVVPSGRWTIGPIHLKSDMELHFEEGAVLDFVDGPDAYLPAVRTSFSCIECLNYSPMVYAWGCTNVSVTGKGLLMPRMDFWRTWFDRNTPERVAATGVLYGWGENDVPVEQRDATKMKDGFFRPSLVEFERCKNVRLEDFTVRESPCWTIHLRLCEDVTVRGLDLRAQGHNNDGIDIDASKRVLVENCTLDQGDDGFVIKSGRDRDGRRVGVAVEDVEIRNCVLRNGYTLMAVGSEVAGGVRNIWIHDCRAIGGDLYTLLSIKTSDRKGAFIENVRMDHVTATRADCVMRLRTDVNFQWGRYPARETAVTEINGVSCTDVQCEVADQVYRLVGDARKPPRNLSIARVNIGRLRKSVGSVTNVLEFMEKDIVFGTNETVAAALRRPILPTGWNRTASSMLLARAHRADSEQNAAATFDPARRERQLQFLGMGEMSKTLINAKITATHSYCGYRVENLLFESSPGEYVTANVYVPINWAANPPYPALLLLCGHNADGKTAPCYRYMATRLAEVGYLVLVMDPLGQGERAQRDADASLSAVFQHHRIGYRALLAGRSMAGCMLWDEIRAIDYLVSRSDVDAERIGALGHSGGGTQCALVAAFDSRVKASAPSGYLSSLWAQASLRGLADPEQVMYGSLAGGLNHAGLILAGGHPVKIHASWDDIVPFIGTQATLETVQRIGGEDRYQMHSQPGPHRWNESALASSINWFNHWLRGRKLADNEKYLRTMDYGFDVEEAAKAFAPPEEDLRVTPEGAVRKLAGFRSIYTIMREGLASGRKRRALKEVKAKATTIDLNRRADGARLERKVWTFGDGMVSPAVVFSPAKRSGLPPVLVFEDRGREKAAARVENFLAEGREVMVADLFATGETRKCRTNIYSREHEDEEAAKFLLLLGESLPERRAEEIVFFAEEMARQTGGRVDVSAGGCLLIPARLAAASRPDLFGKVEGTESVPSWREMFDSEDDLSLCDVVPGAMVDELITLTNEFGSVGVNLHGGDVMFWRNAKGDDLFRRLSDGTGGARLCWPWFANDGHEHARRHGIARYHDFAVVGRTANRLELAMKANDRTRKEFPYDFELTVKYVLERDHLEIEVTGRNTGKEPFMVSEAIHPYLPVTDPEACRIDGDVANGTIAVKTGPARRCKINVSGGKASEITFGGAGAEREIKMKCSGAGSAIVWNPGESLANSAHVTSKLAPGEWRKFVCVETGNVDENVYELKSGESHVFKVQFFK